MRTAITCTVILSLFLFCTEVASAQQKALPQLRQYTPEERWARLEQNFNTMTIGAIGYIKSLNRTSDDLAQYFVKVYAPTWGKPNSRSPMSVFRGMRYNFNSFPSARFELIDSLENKVTGRYERWYAPSFKDSATQYGVSLAEFEGLFRAFNRGVAEYLGLVYEDRVEGEWVNFSLTKK
jgi:hypothetical protein